MRPSDPNVNGAKRVQLLFIINGKLIEIPAPTYRYTCINSDTRRPNFLPTIIRNTCEQLSRGQGAGGGVAPVNY